MLFVDYLDILGPYNPSKTPPAGFKKIFHLRCARQVHAAVRAADRRRTSLTRAYRRPATPEEVSGSCRARDDGAERAIRSKRASEWPLKPF